MSSASVMWQPDADSTIVAGPRMDRFGAELDGDFGGNLATDTIIVVANYDDCTAAQQARFAFEADAADQTIGDSGDPAVIWSDD